MKKFKRRSRLKIYADLLSVLHSEPRADCEKIVLSRVQARINVPFDRLKKYIADLVELNLIENDASLKVTKKGRLFLIEYNRVLDFMKRIGLSYR